MSLLSLLLQTPSVRAIIDVRWAELGCVGTGEQTVGLRSSFKQQF
jgi:hypothetical protein